MNHCQPGKTTTLPYIYHTNQLIETLINVQAGATQANLNASFELIGVLIQQLAVQAGQWTLAGREMSV